MTFDGLTITVGPPGSGKSTWADDNLPPEALRLERDRFRECLFGSRRGYHEHPMGRDAKSHIITSAMYSVMQEWPHPCWAITDTATRYDSVKPFINFAQIDGAPIRLVVFERDEDFLWTNNRVRPHAHRIPEDILRDMIGEFNSRDAWWRTCPHEVVFA